MGKHIGLLHLQKVAGNLILEWIVPHRSACGYPMGAGVLHNLLEAWRHGEEWCQGRWALDGCLSWRILVKAKRVTHVSNSWGTSWPQRLLEAIYIGRVRHTIFMHTPSNYWMLTPVYTDISGSATASPKPLEANSWSLASMNLFSWGNCPHQRHQLDLDPFPWVQSQRELYTFCASRWKRAFQELWVRCSNDSDLTLSILREGEITMEEM